MASRSSRTSRIYASPVLPTLGARDVSALPLAIPVSTSVIPAAMQANYQQPVVVNLNRVATPSGQYIEVLGDAERDFYEGQRKSYMTQNLFTEHL